MPDTKSGIKHLSNMTSMHQNIYISLRNTFTKQFKSNMKVYTQEINVVKDELARLKLEKDKYIKQADNSHINAVELSSGTTNTPNSEPEMTQSEAFEEIRKQNELTNEALARKARSFSASPSSRRWSTSTIIEVDEDAIDEEYYDKSDVSGGARKEWIEDDPLVTKLYTNKARRRNIYLIKPKLKPFHKPTFKNDRFVNTTVNNARAKLTALYRHSVLGPGSLKQSAHLVVPSLSPNSRLSSPAASQHRLPQQQQQQQQQQPKHGSIRSQSAAAPTSEQRIRNQRKSLSAGPGFERSPPANTKKSVLSERSTYSPYMVTFDESVELERPHKRRERQLREIQENLTARYKNFEDSLHRRMMIREMKAAEYDANHRIQSTFSLQEVIPSSKTSAVSEALRRQSAIIALERSILGGLG